MARVDSQNPSPSQAQWACLAHDCASLQLQQSFGACYDGMQHGFRRTPQQNILSNQTIFPLMQHASPAYIRFGMGTGWHMQQGVRYNDYNSMQDLKIVQQPFSEAQNESFWFDPTSHLAVAQEVDQRVVTSRPFDLAQEKCRPYTLPILVSGSKLDPVQPRVTEQVVGHSNCISSLGVVAVQNYSEPAPEPQLSAAQEKNSSVDLGLPPVLALPVKHRLEKQVPLQGASKFMLEDSVSDNLYRVEVQEKNTFLEILEIIRSPATDSEKSSHLAAPLPSMSFDTPTKELLAELSCLDNTNVHDGAENWHCLANEMLANKGSNSAGCCYQSCSKKIKLLMSAQAADNAKAAENVQAARNAQEDDAAHTAEDTEAAEDAQVAQDTQASQDAQAVEDVQVVAETCSILHKQADLFFKKLPAHGEVERLMNFLKANEKMHGVLIAGTGSGKTLGIAIFAALNQQKVLIVLPKVVQVNLLVQFLKKDIFPSLKIGIGTGNEKNYDLHGSYNIIVVTYGHLLHSIVNKYAKGNPALFGDYILVFDEVHESHGEIQAVLALAPHIPCQTIITSATIHSGMLNDLKNNSYFKVFENETESVCNVKILYKPLSCAISNRKQLAQHVNEIVKEYINCDGKILIFVSGQSDMDRIVDMLIKTQDLSEDKVASVHAELWEDEIIEAVRDAKVIVGTNILESSVTISNLSVVIDTMLKNELVNNTLLRESHISRAEATQRAGRAGRNEMRTGTVVRIMSEEDFNLLNEYPEKPFKLSDPLQIYLLMARAFPSHVSSSDSTPSEVDSHSDQDCASDCDVNETNSCDSVCSVASKPHVDQLLGLDKLQATRCLSELQRVGAIDISSDRGDKGSSSVTAFGDCVLSLKMSLRFACPLAQVIVDPASCEERLSFALILFAALENWPTYLFTIPRSIRLSSFKDQVEYVRTECEELVGFSSAHTIVGLFLEATKERSLFTGRHGIDKRAARIWFDRRKINSKFAVMVLCDLAKLVVKRITGGSSRRLSDISALRQLQFRLCPKQLRADTQLNVDRFIAEAMGSTLQYFTERYVTTEGRKFARVSEDGALVETVHGAMLESLQHAPQPLYAGALVRQVRERVGRPQSLSITLIFPAPRFPLYRVVRDVVKRYKKQEQDCFCEEDVEENDDDSAVGGCAGRAAGELALLAVHAQGRKWIVEDGMLSAIVVLAMDSLRGLGRGGGQSRLHQRRHAAAALVQLSDDKAVLPKLLSCGATEALLRLVEAREQALQAKDLKEITRALQNLGWRESTQPRQATAATGQAPPLGGRMWAGRGHGNTADGDAWVSGCRLSPGLAMARTTRSVSSVGGGCLVSGSGGWDGGGQNSGGSYSDEGNLRTGSCGVTGTSCCGPGRGRVISDAVLSRGNVSWESCSRDDENQTSSTGAAVLEKGSGAGCGGGSSGRDRRGRVDVTALFTETLVLAPRRSQQDYGDDNTDECDAEYSLPHWPGSRPAAL